MNILELRNIKKVYDTGSVKTEALSDINFSVKKGEFVAIMGESGSGKTTLLNIIATLDNQTEGSVFFNGDKLVLKRESDVARFRRTQLGFVFQDFNLLDTFNNRDNIFLPLVLSDFKYNEMRSRLSKIQGPLGIEKILDKYPHQVSGGQKQRIAIARAIITNPSIVLADEPTGALDSNSSSMIMGLFDRINKAGQTILMVTHSLKSASYASRVLFIKDGVVYHEIYKGSDDNQTFMEKIMTAQSVLNKRGV